MNKPTTIRQRKFIKQFIRTRNGTEAAMQAYNCKSRAVAAVISSQVLRKLNISFIELMNKMGLNDERDISDLIKLRKAKITKHFAYEGQVVDERSYDDNATQLKALEMTLKLKGHLKEQIEHSGEVAFTQMPNARVGNRIGDLLPLELNIGEPDIGVARNPANAGEAAPDTN